MNYLKLILITIAQALWGVGSMFLGMGLLVYALMANPLFAFVAYTEPKQWCSNCNENSYLWLLSEMRYGARKPWINAWRGSVKLTELIDKLQKDLKENKEVNNDSTK